MKARSLLQTAQEVSRVAQAVAIAGIGLRGEDAKVTMRKAARAETARIARERIEAILYATRASRFEPVGESDVHENEMETMVDACPNGRPGVPGNGSMGMGRGAEARE